MIIYLIIGLLFIGLGFLVGRYPELISGYNTMSRKKKENVDKIGLARHMKIGMVGMGCLILLFCIPLFFTKYNYLADYFMITILFGGLLIIFVGAQKYDHNQYGRWHWILYLVFFLIMLSIPIFIIYGMRPAQIILNEQTISIKGLEGTEINLSDIQDVEIVRTEPDVNMRVHGFSVGSVHKGTFRLAEGGNCRLYLHSNTGPYLKLTDQSGFPTYINFKDTTIVHTLYQSLK